MSRYFAYWILLLGIGYLVGCSGKQEGEEAPPASTNEASEANSAASGNPLTAPVDYLGAIAKAKKSTEVKIALTSLQQAIRLFQVQESRLPNNLEELVEKNYLPKLPKSPPQTDWSYDPASGQVALAAAKE